MSASPASQPFDWPAEIDDMWDGRRGLSLPVQSTPEPPETIASPEPSANAGRATMAEQVAFVLRRDYANRVDDAIANVTAQPHRFGKAIP